jgi:hypothetical protein
MIDSYDIRDTYVVSITIIYSSETYKGSALSVGGYVPILALP